MARVLYLDESGIGKIKHERHLIIAGVLINQDRQWLPIKNHLQSLLEDALPAGVEKPAYLHAADIYHGWGDFHRDRWPEPVRHMLLDNIAKIPEKFRVPVIWGLVDRQVEAKRHPEDTPQQQLIDCYAAATMLCLLQLEWYMRNGIMRTEMASITMEHNGHLQKRIKEIFRAAASPKVLEDINEEHDSISKLLLPISKVIDEPSFQEKTMASVLQLADFCAWALKRAAGKERDHERFAKPFAVATLRWGNYPVDKAWRRWHNLPVNRKPLSCRAICKIPFSTTKT